MSDQQSYPQHGRVPAQRRVAQEAWPPPQSSFRPSAALIVALIAVVLAAIFELSFQTTETVNGVVTECTYFNLSPLLFGPVAAIAGLMAVRRSDQPGRNRPVERIVGVLAAVIGVVHVLGAFGLLGGFTFTLAGDGPC